MIEIRRYTHLQTEEWNRFIAQSKNGTFLFDRDYMDYHSDRFSDYSLMVYRNGKLHALLPANVEGNTLYSHQGLTYGGLITDKSATVTHVLEIFQILNHHLREEGIERVVYKPTPWIYHQLLAEEDLYALFTVCKARLTAREVSSAILREQRLPFTESRRSGIRKAQAAGITIEESADIKQFWNILNENLYRTHGVHPVHSLEELTLLCNRFPDHIHLFAAQQEGQMLGGTLIYDTGQVVHTQYISASPEGKNLGVLDMLFDYIINDKYAHAHCIDFGKSTTDGGTCLNQNLIFQKEGFGGRAVCYDTYEWEIEE
ncbi:MAG: GNAT family N-acetyltransferase [Prevotella sp.]|nr:GNAT family N-acetyltransferase [Prevotella sp.]